MTLPTNKTYPYLYTDVVYDVHGKSLISLYFLTPVIFIQTIPEIWWPPSANGGLYHLENQINQTNVWHVANVSVHQL